MDTPLHALPREERAARWTAKLKKLSKNSLLHWQRKLIAMVEAGPSEHGPGRPLHPEFMAPVREFTFWRIIAIERAIEKRDKGIGPDNTTREDFDRFGTMERAISLENSQGNRNPNPAQSLDDIEAIAAARARLLVNPDEHL